MDKSLVGYEIPVDVRQAKVRLEQGGYSFVHLDDSRLIATLDFVRREFSNGWVRCIREGLLEGLPCRNFLLAIKGDEVPGFTMFRAYDNVAERFGPFGVSAKARRLGLERSSCTTLSRSCRGRPAQRMVPVDGRGLVSRPPLQAGRVQGDQALRRDEEDPRRARLPVGRNPALSP